MLIGIRPVLSVFRADADTALEVIVIDDFVPCTASQQDPGGIARLADGMPKARLSWGLAALGVSPSEAMYARPHGKEIWTMLLEKARTRALVVHTGTCGNFARQAFAKLCGSYASIEAALLRVVFLWVLQLCCVTHGNKPQTPRPASQSGELLQ